MQSIPKTIAILATMATVLLGAALVSGWTSVAIAGEWLVRVRTPLAAGHCQASDGAQ